MDKITLCAKMVERLAVIGKIAQYVYFEVGAVQRDGRDLLDSAKSGFLRVDKLNAQARALDTTTAYLTATSGKPDPFLSDVEIGGRPIDRKALRRDPPPIKLVGTIDCATIRFEYETGQMLEIERCRFNFDRTVRMIVRPLALQGARDLYAIYLHGESMMPRFELGEVGIVHPTRTDASGD